MAKVKPDTKEAPEAQNTNDFAESFFKDHSEALFNHIQPLNRFISSGSLILDQYVKARSGGVIRLVAKTPESGKSSQSFVYAENFMKTMPKSKTAYVMAEGRLSPELRARTGLTFVYHPRDWVYGTVLVMATNEFETVADFIVKMSKRMFDAEERLCIIIDSLDGLILKADKETKGISGGVVAGVPKLTKLLFRHVALPIAFYDILLVITGQFSADISIDPYAPKQVRLGDASGGNSVPHQCDYIIQYLPRYGGDFILEDDSAKPDPIKNKIIGLWATAEIKKSATDTTGVKVKIPIKKGRVGCAIWVEKEVADLCLAYGIVTKAGSWLSFNEKTRAEAQENGITLKEKVQGMNALYEYMETEKPAFDWLHTKFKKMLGTETVTE